MRFYLIGDILPYWRLYLTLYVGWVYLTTTTVIPYPFLGMTIYPLLKLNLLKVITLYLLLLTATSPLGTVCSLALKNLHMSTLLISLFRSSLNFQINLLWICNTITTAPHKPLNSQALYSHYICLNFVRKKCCIQPCLYQHTSVWSLHVPRL